MAIAGTDVAQHRRFADSAEAHRIGMVNALNTANIASADEWDDPIDSDSLWASIPPFTYSAAPLREALSSHGLSLAALAAWLLFAVFLFRSLKQVRVS